MVVNILVGVISFIVGFIVARKSKKINDGTSGAGGGKGY